MAGSKGHSGGKRIGAGRKPSPPDEIEINGVLTPITEIASKDPIKGTYKGFEKKYKLMQVCDMKDLKCPVEFDDMPYAKKAWEYCLELDKHSKYHLLNERHFESLKNYCLAVELRENLVNEWKKQGKETTIVSGNSLKINPVCVEMSNQAKIINTFAEQLGLTVLSEFKMATVKSKAPNMEESEDDLFD